MNNTTTQTTPDNWQSWADKAAQMTNSELIFAISDCVATSRLWESDGRCGGRYRDEASVLRAELAKRPAACDRCDESGDLCDRCAMDAAEAATETI